MKGGRGTRPSVVWRDLDGIVLLDKPAGMSSNQALQRVRHRFRAEKGGHTGSLDPLATGLLPICFGEATKIAGLLLGSRKAYRAECRLGITTTTDDAEGDIVRERPVPRLDAESLHGALRRLTGRITQIPPVYSALKQGGVPLYRRARRGEEVVVPPREVEVFRFELLAAEAEVLRLEVECGSGTYVRSLVRDLGEALGCGAHLTALRRLWIEPFRNPVMHTLEALNDLASTGENALDAIVLPLETGLVQYPQRTLAAPDVARLRAGQAVQGPPAGDVLDPCVAVDEHGRAVALVRCESDGILRVLRGFRPRDAERSAC